MYKIQVYFSFLLTLGVFINGQLKDSLKSWQNVSRINVYKTGETDTRATIEIDDDQSSVLEFKLHQRSTLHGDHIETSVTSCLYEGFLIQDSKVDTNSPLRLKQCTDDTGNVLELSGLIFFNRKVFTLHLNEDGSIILFNHADVKTDAMKVRKCDALEKDLDKQLENSRNVNVFPKRMTDLNEEFLSERYRRQSSYKQQERNYVEILVVISNEYYQKYGSSNQTVIDNAVEIVHFADFYYAVIPNINLHLSLVDVVIFTDVANDTTDGIDDISLVLSNFRDLQTLNLKEWPHHDNAVLLITRNFTTASSTVGLAYLNTLCDSTDSASWVKDGDTTAVMGGTLAHELGHNIGLNHNPENSTDPCACQVASCVMDAVSTSGMPVEVFTSCQQTLISNFLQTGSAICLHNEPTKTLDAPYCGDYIVNQVSEECDCGSNDTCEDPCCHPQNCTLVTGAKCSSMDLCCEPTTCGVKASGVVCRDAVNTCDIEEQCDGVNVQCPSDLYHSTGDNCTENGVEGHCYLGNCRSHYAQCAQIFNATASNLWNYNYDICWSLNTIGDKWGNCGSNLVQNYTACLSENIQCGKLQCPANQSSSAEALISTTVHTITFGSQKCFAINDGLVSIDAIDDLAYVHDGISCGTGKFCLNRKCVDISFMPGVCPSDCSGNGVCNVTTKECQCYPGYSGLSCTPTQTTIFAATTIPVLGTTVQNPDTTVLGTGLATTVAGAGPATTVPGAGPATTVAGAGTETTFVGAGPVTTVDGAGPATTLAGAGPATTLAGAGPATMLAGAGPATTLAGAGPATTVAGTGPATTVAGLGPATTVAGAGPATTVAGTGPATTLAGAGPATTLAGAGPATMLAGAGPATTVAATTPAVITATESVAKTIPKNNEEDIGMRHLLNLQSFFLILIINAI